MYNIKTVHASLKDKEREKMKLSYETPELTVFILDARDVITTSDWDIELPKQEFSW